MIISRDENGVVTEMQCDICGCSYDDKNELAEFMCFDYTMGEVSLFPNRKITFDCCQDCFTDAFPDVFTEGEEVSEEESTGGTNGETTKTVADYANFKTEADEWPSNN